LKCGFLLLAKQNKKLQVEIISIELAKLVLTPDLLRSGAGQVVAPVSAAIETPLHLTFLT
jgi:hypothetical protein